MCPKNVEEAEKSFEIRQATKTNDGHVYLLVEHLTYGKLIQKLESVEFNISIPKHLPKITTNYPEKYDDSVRKWRLWSMAFLWLGQAEGNDSISIIWVCSSIFTTLTTLLFQLRIN